MRKVTYDPEVKILMIYLSKEKIVDSDTEGNCIFDYDANGNVVDIEVMLDFPLEELIDQIRRK